MAGKSLLDAVRSAAHAWVAKVEIAELVMMLPASAFAGEAAKSEAPRANPNPAAGEAAPKRRRRRVRRLTPDQGATVRERLKGLTIGSPEYRKAQGELCEELGANRRQITGAVMGKIAAAAKARKRKRGVKK